MRYEDPRHTMNVVTRRTGLSPHVVRVWERRYGAVSPDRTDTNRRLYSDADVDRLRLLYAATKAGHSIGQIAQLELDDLQELLQDAQELQPIPSLKRDEDAADQTPDIPPFTIDAEATQLLDRCKRAAKHMDSQALERTLQEAKLALTQPMLLDNIIVPLMEWVGIGWREGELRVVNEHLVSAVVRHFLTELRSSYGPHEAAPVILLSTPAGQNHELGALVAAAVAAAEGWHEVYLGPNLPAEEIARGAQETGARAVGISIVYPLDDPNVIRELRQLREYLPPQIAILAGGRGSNAYLEVLKEIGALLARDSREMRSALDIARGTVQEA
jgi:DNA-binding transcriptional MerR regulator/methylmalonyl-CoA mutase cobalamin-binding subunit